MKKEVVYLVIGIIGLGAGIGAGFLVNKPKLAKSKAAYDELQTKLQETEKSSLEKLQMAGADNAKLNTELKRINAELTRYKAEYVRATTDLTRVTTELNNLKESILPQSEVVDVDSAVQASSSGDTSSSGGTAAAATSTAPKTPVAASGEYIIKDGDNLWNIAAAQLGKGIRYKEILALNPGLSEKKELVVGSKIKLPAK
jgi:nucleoid-associated protein YgaU